MESIDAQNERYSMTFKSNEHILDPPEKFFKFKSTDIVDGGINVSNKQYWLMFKSNDTCVKLTFDLTDDVVQSLMKFTYSKLEFVNS